MVLGFWFQSRENAKQMDALIKATGTGNGNGTNGNGHVVSSETTTKIETKKEINNDKNPTTDRTAADALRAATVE